MNKKTLAITLMGVICVVGAVLYMDYYAHFRDCFVPGTKINHIPVKGMDLAAATYSLEKDYALTVKFREGRKEKVKGKDIDFHLDSHGAVARVLEEQNFGDYLKSFVIEEDFPVEMETVFSEEKLLALVDSWPEMDQSTMEEPVDAHISYEEGTFSIQPETQGTWLYRDKAIAAVDQAVNEAEKILDMDAVRGIYDSAEVTKDDPALAKDLDTLQGMEWNTVTYKLPSGEKRVLDANTTKDWLKRGTDGVLKKKQGAWNRHIAQYVEQLAEDVDTVGKKHPFKTHSGKLIKLKSTGYYGWRVDRDRETVQLAKDLKRKDPVKRRPVYIQTESAPTTDNYGFGQKYVEIDLGRQHLWLYDKGKVVLESDVVSGNRSGHASPDGAFMVLDKRRNVVLRGPEVKEKATDKDGKKKAPSKPKYEWESPVSYWMALTYDGVGMHDANWRGAFGGSIWTYNGSHGCINLPVSFAPKLYSRVRVKTPVAVYY